MSWAFLVLVLMFVVLPLGTIWILTRNAPMGWEDDDGFHFSRPGHGGDRAQPTAPRKTNIVAAAGPETDQKRSEGATPSVESNHGIGSGECADTPSESCHGSEKPRERDAASRFDSAINMELGDHEPFEVITASPPCEHFAKGSSKRLAGRQIVRHLSKLP